MFRKRKQKQMLEEARRREAELERQKRNQVSLEELQLLRDFRTSLIMPHLAKEFDILRSSSPENTIEEAPEPSTSQQKQTFQDVAPLSPPPRKAKAPVISNTPTGTALQVSPWLNPNDSKQYSSEEPLTPISESFGNQSTPSLYSTTSLDSERSDLHPDQYRDLAAWRAERNKRHYSNQIFGGKQRLDHYRLAKERSKTSLHESTLPEKYEPENLMPVNKPLPAIQPELPQIVEDLSVGDQQPSAPVVVDDDVDSIFPKELTQSTSQPLKPLPTAKRPKPRGRTRPDIRRYSIDPLSKWIDHTTTGYDNDQSLELNENYFFNDFAPDAENRRPRPKSRRMSKAAAKILAENPTGKTNNPGRIDLAAIAKHLHENRLSVIQERKRISATEEDEQELARLLADPHQATKLEMHRDNAFPKPPQPSQSPPTKKPSANDNAVSSAQAATAAIMRTRSASTSKADKPIIPHELTHTTKLTSSASMRISPLHSMSSGHAGNARPIHFLGSNRANESTTDDNNDTHKADDETAEVKEKTNGVETANPDLAKKIQLNDKQVLSRAGSTVDRSPSTRLAAIQGIQKHMREKSNQNSRQSSETEADSKEDESQTIIEEIPTTPISEDEHQLLREPSTSTPINVKSRKDKPRIAILDSAAASTEVPDPSAFESPRTAPAPPMVNSDISFNVEPSRSGSKLHKASRNRTKSSNDTDDEDKDGKSGFMQFRRQVSKLRRPRAGSESGTQPKLSGLKHAVSHDAMSPLSSYTGVESMREAKSSRLVNINDNVSSSATTNGKLSLPNNGQPRRSISMREIRSPSMESEDLIGSKQPKANGEEVLMQNKKSPSHNVLHRQTTSVSSTVSGSSDERFSSVKRSESGRSTSEDSAGSPQISPRNPLRHSRDDSGKSRAAISRSGSARGLERMSNEHKVASQSKLKDGDISPRSTLGSSKLTPAAFSAMKHAEDVKDAPIRSDIVKKLERQTSGSKGIRMISQLLGKSGKKNSTKRVNSNSTESSNADVNCSQEQPPDLSKERSSARSSQVVRRMIIYVQPEDSEEQSANSNTISGLNSIQERASLSSDSSHINSPDSDTGHEYVTAKVITRQPSLKKTVVDGDQPQVTTGSGLTRKGTNGRKWRLENVKEETEAAASTKSAISADTDTLPRSSYSSSIPRSSYDNDSIYKFYNSRTSTSERSLDSVQRASMRSAAHAQLEGLEVREMSDGSVVYGIVKKDRNGRRTSVLLPTNNEQYPVETEILTSDEDEDEIEDRVLQLMGYNPDSPRLSDFTDVDRRSRKTSKEMVPSKSNDRSLQRLPPPQYPPPPIPTRSPRRMASIKQQQQLKPKVSRVQDHRAKHISTIASKSPDGNGATTDIYVAEEATLSGLLDMIKDTGDDMDDYYGEYYSDQTYFPDSDTEVSTDRMTRSATVEEKLDDALKTWEQTSSRRAQPHFQ